MQSGHVTPLHSDICNIHDQLEIIPTMILMAFGPSLGKTKQWLYGKVQRKAILKTLLALTMKYNETPITFTLPLCLFSRHHRNYSSALWSLFFSKKNLVCNKVHTYYIVVKFE